MADYPFALPWLKPADGGQQGANYVAGYSAAAKVELEKAQLRQQAQLAQLKSQVEADQLNQQMLISQQKIEQQKAYQDAQIGLQAEALDFKQQQLFQKDMADRARLAQNQQQIDVTEQYRQNQLAMQQKNFELNNRKYGLDITNASQRWAAQKEYAEAIKAAGGDRQKQLEAMLLYGPRMSTSGSLSGLPGMLKQTTEEEFIPKAPIDVEGMPGWKVGQASKNRWQYFPPTAESGMPTVSEFQDPALANKRWVQQPGSKTGRMVTIAEPKDTAEIKKLKDNLASYNAMPGELTEEDKKDMDDLRAKLDAALAKRDAELKARKPGQPTSIIPGTNAAPKAAKAPSKSLSTRRKDAMDAIARGADEAAVRKRFKELTGEEL